MADLGDSQLLVRFVTKQEQYAVPDSPIAIQSNVLSSDLNTLLKALLKETNPSLEKVADFDFLICGELLCTSIAEHIQEKGISTEDTLEVEYLERFPAPRPQDCLMHDDWVSAVHTQGNWILSGCYDNSIHIWSTKGQHKLSIPGHTSPVKAVSWVSVTNEQAIFVRYIGKYISLSDEHNAPAKKKSRPEQGKIREPLTTLKGHREAVSGIKWMDFNTVVSSGWDHLIKIWDCELGGLKQEIAGNKAFFDLDWSPLNNNIITASADRHIRLYDPRSTDSIVRTTYTSHNGWVQSVRWSTTKDTLFLSAGYDGQVKLWETRSPKTPLYDLSGHEDKVLCCDWSNPALLISGSCDNTLRIFKSKHALQ
ncbi:ribosome biogenesis protein WDR12 [Danaus plexippus plexippus]|uniref:Ribosome biogenesis protein WDR12 n=1 Tax=Danaus plexippus plexippus TaxID=278856 RepID=A0A212EU55_DANPL|nr:ribosome biogenesis protein WDR12 [Danaus plexippus plexippus]